MLKEVNIIGYSKFTQYVFMLIYYDIDKQVEKMKYLEGADEEIDKEEYRKLKGELIGNICILNNCFNFNDENEKKGVKSKRKEIIQKLCPNEYYEIIIDGEYRKNVYKLQESIYKNYIEISLEGIELIINEVINKSKEWIDIWQSYSGGTITFTNPYTPEFLIGLINSFNKFLVQMTKSKKLKGICENSILTLDGNYCSSFKETFYKPLKRMYQDEELAFVCSDKIRMHRLKNK